MRDKNEKAVADKRPELPSFIVDEDNVLREASRHAKDYYLWRTYVTKLETRLDELENSMENTLGPMRDIIRDELIAKRGRSGATEKAVADAIRSDVKARSLYQNILKYRKAVALSKAVLAALDRKTEMIKALAFALNRANSAGL